MTDRERLLPRPTAQNRPRMPRRMPAWLARWARRFLALPIVLGLAGAADAQAPARAVYANKNSISLPILLDKADRPHLKEVQLHVKENPAAPWTLKERVPPTQTFFNYRAPGDGEYSFAVVTVDHAGKTVPADVRSEPPALTVIVDTTPPSVNLHLLENTREGQQVLVEGQDPNHDPMKTRFFYQTGDRNWRPLDCLPGTPEQFCIPGVAVLTGMVRVQASDRAGNTSTREFNVNSMVAPAASPVATVPPGTVPPGSVPPGGTPAGPAMGTVVDIGGTKVALTPPAPLPKEVLTPPGARPEGPTLEKGPALPPPIEIVDLKDPTIIRTKYVDKAPIPPLPAPVIEPELPPRTEGKGISVEVPPRDERKDIITLPKSVDIRDIPRESAPRDPSSLPVNMVNNTRVYLDYQIESLGASGVGRVEVWLTRDKGQSWQKVGEDKDLKSPAEVTLPGEGVFGVTLVVTNGRGFGGTPPQPGDQADHWLEVDVTRPSGEILAVRPSGADDGSLFVSWSARDKKLSIEPIDLYFSPTREGPWTPIAKGIKNDGSYRWVPPRDVAAHAFLRMVIHDQAGNFTTCETTHPVALDDLSRPRGRVLGISTTPKGPGLE